MGTSKRLLGGEPLAVIPERGSFTAEFEGNRGLLLAVRGVDRSCFAVAGFGLPEHFKPKRPAAKGEPVQLSRAFANWPYHAEVAQGCAHRDGVAFKHRNPMSRACG